MADASRTPIKDGTFFLDLLQVRVLELAGGSGKLQIDIQERHLRSLGILHGGVLASLLDSVMGMSANSMAPPDHYTVTVQMNVNFIRPAWLGETLMAAGKVVHTGRQTAVAQAEVRTGDGNLVGTGTATFMYLRHNEHTRQKIEKLPDNEITRPETEAG